MSQPPLPLLRLLLAAARCGAAYAPAAGDDPEAERERASAVAHRSIGDCQWTLWRDDDPIHGRTCDLVFRGSESLGDFVADAKFRKTRGLSLSGRRVGLHRGGADMFGRAWSHIQGDLQEAITDRYRLVLGGHSLGAMLASYAGLRLSPVDVVGVHLIESPRPGDAAFRDEWAHAACTWRVSHAADIVDDLPPVSCGYRHLAVPTLWIDDAGRLHHPPPRFAYIFRQVIRFRHGVREHSIGAIIRALRAAVAASIPPVG